MDLYAACIEVHLSKMRDPLAAIEAFLLHPFAALAIGLVLLVIGWRMDSGASSYFLLAAWVLLALSTFRAFSAQALVPRLLWTMLISSVLGLLLYHLEIRTAKKTVMAFTPTRPTAEVAAPEMGVSELKKESPLPSTATLTAEQIAEAIVRRSEPTSAEKARRGRLRRDLTQYLVRGTVERDRFRILLQPTIEEVSRKPVDNTEKLGQAMLRIHAWDTEFVAYVGSRLGGDRALWLMNKVPSGRYPNNIGDVPGLSQSWDVVTSDIAKVEELLREFPELPGAAVDFEYARSSETKHLFSWRSEPVTSGPSVGDQFRERITIRANRALTDPMFEIAFSTVVTGFTIARSELPLLITTPVRYDRRWLFDVMHPLAEGREIVITVQSGDAFRVDDVRLAFW